MPQLDLAPWCFIFIVSWLLLATILPVKMTAHVFPNPPTDNFTTQPKASNWNWSW